MTMVFLDANVLYSNTTRSLFVWLHINKVIEVCWSMEVWEETFIAFGRSHNSLETTKFRSSMTKNAITGYPLSMVRPLKYPAVGLKDINDEHVVAAARTCNADYLVTLDEALLAEDLTKLYLVQIKPDDLIMGVLLKTTPKTVVQSVQDHITNLSKSKPTLPVYLEGLRKAGLIGFAEWLESQRKSKKLFAEVW
jgi:predicted nucleic acid-binding protein